MKKSKKILLGIMVVIVIVSGVIIYKNWNTISAFVDSFRYSQDDVQNKLDENKEFLNDYISGEGGIAVRDLTEDEAAALTEGKLTEEEVIELLVGTTEPSPTPTPSSTPSVSSNSVSAPTQTPLSTPTPVPSEVEDAKKRVAEVIARLYIQKNTYLNKLDAIEAQVRAEFINLYQSDKDKYTNKDEYKGAKNKFLTEYLPTVASWEKECDTVVFGIIDEIRVILKESGQSQDVAEKLKEAYLSEKKLKKTYFINRYMD